jgi:CRP-like cAMP-binding protein
MPYTCYFTLFFHEQINDYMDMTHLPHNLRRRIRRYCLFRRDGALHQKEQEIWAFLSPSLRLEAALHQYLPILEQVPYFRETSSHFVSELACHLTQLVYGPNEVLVAQGTKERVMFILNKGRVHVEKDTQSDGIQILASLSDGSFFGEQALLFGTFRNATVRSLSFCNVCVLRKCDVDGVLDKYPADKTLLKKLLIRRMWKTTFLNPEFRQALTDHAKKKSLLRKKMKKIEAPSLTSAEASSSISSSNNNNSNAKKKKKKKKKDRSDRSPVRKNELKTIASPKDSSGSETKISTTLMSSLSSSPLPPPPAFDDSSVKLTKLDNRFDVMEQKQANMMNAITQLTSKIDVLLNVLIESKKKDKEKVVPVVKDLIIGDDDDNNKDETRQPMLADDSTADDHSLFQSTAVADEVSESYR